MKNSALIFFLIVGFMVALAIPGQTAEDAPHIAYTKHFLRNYPKRLERALELMPMVEGYSAINSVPTLAVAVLISVESSWKTGAQGDIGEHGLMQVHGQCAKGHDMSTPEGQIAAGTSCLAAAYEACDGSLKQALTMYQSGSCTPRTKRTKRRIAHRLAIIKKWGK